ncbi:hypothetical protein V2J09_017879 [Rumex salicifolius]
MCNKEVDSLGDSSFAHSGTSVDQEQHQTALRMDSPSTNAAAAATGSFNDDIPRVKFLCSFSGSILPRPQDGKLRYVGGETRIVSVQRDISYEELMVRMRELYDGAAILKYQQPDEDLDALVSVVNDDDVTNMMEEYDKLGSGDVITRLRIFLFSHPDHDASLHYIDGDERDTERRYVDALNSLNESPDYRRHQLGDSPVLTPVDDTHISEQFFSSLNIESSLHNQRNYEMPTQQYNLRHLAIPNVRSGNHSASVGQRFNDEAPWSPAYYSPRCAGPQDPHPLAEIPSSPSSQFLAPHPDFRESVDRVQEEYGRLPVTSHPAYDHPTSYSDNVVWMQPGGLPIEKGGFPGNILQGSLHTYDGSSVCGNCKMAFQRNHSLADSQWKFEQHSHIEHSIMSNEFIPVGNPCIECPPKEEVLILNPDLKMQHGIYNNDQTDPRSLYGETLNQERGWVVQHPLPPRAEEPRGQISGAGRVNDHYVLDGTNMKFPAHGNLSDGHHATTNFVHQEENRYVRTGPELGNDVFHGQSSVSGSHFHVPLDERNVRHANIPYSFGVENSYQLSHGHPSAHTLYRNVPAAMPIPSTYDAPNLHQRSGTVSPGLPRAAVEGGPVFSIGVDHTWVEPSYGRPGIEGVAIPEYPFNHASKVNPTVFYQDKQQSQFQDSSQNALQLSNSATPQETVNLSEPALTERLAPLIPHFCSPGIRTDPSIYGSTRLEEKRAPDEEKNPSCLISPIERTDVKITHSHGENDNPDVMSLVGSLQPATSNNNRDTVISSVQLSDNNIRLQADNEDILPDLVAVVNKAKMESAEFVKARVQQNDTELLGRDANPEEKGNPEEKEPAVALVNSGYGSDNENPSASKIEQTKAEEEAIARGLQTIRNDDLEEIKELGSGTYGAVYHGKWKGSDVAIKRIKASCFAGRPSERERLIADFWKEALLLSSLHHPNVVSFYGVVRDGPDGSLATVTEFMVNGSLKQYLQKKDRTIDRRKRLIIAMDAAFGMEYLHGKNIVHFDLKCENLLVNMRDPHRPVCKIGDLGLSKVKQHTLVSGGVRGTLPWMAPELLSGKSNMVTEKIDVYSFGIVMWEVLTGDEPYADMHCASIIGGIVNNSLRPQIPAWCDPEWKALMESCWASDPSERPSFSEISHKLRSMAASMNVK